MDEMYAHISMFLMVLRICIFITLVLDIIAINIVIARIGIDKWNMFDLTNIYYC